MEKKLLDIKTITEYNDMLGMETLHPQVSGDRPFESQPHATHATHVQLLCGIPER